MASLSGSRTGSEFRAALRGKGIDVVLRHNDRGRLFGVTFIDHNSRTVLNGSALGKEFSANALSARLADFSVGSSREDLQTSAPSPGGNAQTPQATPTVETSRPAMPSASDDRAPVTHSQTPDLSSVGDAAGSLFSIFTPDAGGQSDNGTAPKKRRKKKRQYGQQT